VPSGRLPAGESEGTTQNGAIVYALAALKNVGTAAMETVVAERAARGSFKDLSDFAARIDPKVLNKRALEMLSSAGAFDALETNRALVHANADVILNEAGRRGEDKANGQFDMLSAMSAGSRPSGVVLELRPTRAWTPMERLEKEFEAVGFYLSGHPLDEYETALQQMGVKRHAEFEAKVDGTAASARLAAIVVSARERKSAKGNKFAFGLFSDASGQFEAIIFSDTLAASRDLLEAGTPVLLTVAAERIDDTLKMRVESIEALDKAVGAVSRTVLVAFDPASLPASHWPAAMRELRATLKPGRGEVRILVTVPGEEREIEIAVPGRHDISPSQRGLISTVPGVVAVNEA
jgi:DNA polymerase-3 subunit alpha